MKSRYWALLGAAVGFAVGFQGGATAAKRQYQEAIGNAIEERAEGSDPTSMYGDDVVGSGDAP